MHSSNASAFIAFFCVAGLALLADGCSPFIPVVAVRDLPPERQAAIGAVKVYEAPDLQGVSWDQVGPVTGNSCQFLLWDPPATQVDAIAQLKHWAVESHVTAIADLKCEAPLGMSLETNCWSSVTCTATAIRVKTQPTIPL